MHFAVTCDCKSFQFQYYFYGPRVSGLTDFSITFMGHVFNSLQGALVSSPSLYVFLVDLLFLYVCEVEVEM